MYYVINQKWHKDQTVKEGILNNTRYIEITLPVGERLNEIIARTMAYAPDSEIISPPRIREKWLEVIKETGKRYL